jgi:hypothetical protein
VKLAKVLEVCISEFSKYDTLSDHVNLPLLEKIKLIDTLGKDEQQAILKNDWFGDCQKKNEGEPLKPD